MCARNGEIEYYMAEDRGQIVRDKDGNDTGHRHTGVIGDGGWGKRSFGHNMSSPSGMVSSSLLRAGRATRRRAAPRACHAVRCDGAVHRASHTARYCKVFHAFGCVYRANNV